MMKSNTLIFTWLLILMGFILLIDKTHDKKEENSSLNKFTDISSNTLQDRILNTYVNWRDHKNFYYSANLKITYYNYLKSIKNRDQSDAKELTSLYVDVINSDYSDLDKVYSSLNYIREDRSLSRKKFAEVIVSMVQHIPYSYVVSNSCRSAALNDSSMNNNINNGTQCEGGVIGGLYTPLEFINKKKGDCDSRTVLIWTILTHFGYDAVILNSDLYGHSIIGLNIPSSGRYKYYRGKRYYTWETTSIGYKVGMLPPSFSNIDKWYVAIHKS